MLEVVSATVTGSSVAGPQLSLTGEFRVKQGQALIGGSHVPAKDLAAMVSVEAGRLKVSNLSGLYGTIHMNESKALVSFLEAGPWLEMDITGEMTAADLLQFLAKTVKSEQLSRLREFLGRSFTAGVERRASDAIDAALDVRESLVGAPGSERHPCLEVFDESGRHLH